ncbi:transglutaminase domain-containing protein [Bdellovibrionota bacterium FG-2]
MVGHYSLRSHQLQDVVPLEKFLEAGYGTCLHKALLASLLLDQLGIPHRLVNGATRSVGHTWIELKDGKILDPSLKKLERPSPSVAFPGWIKYGESIVFENQVWPYLELD